MQPHSVLDIECEICVSYVSNTVPAVEIVFVKLLIDGGPHRPEKKHNNNIAL